MIGHPLGSDLISVIENGVVFYDLFLFLYADYRFSARLLKNTFQMQDYPHSIVMLVFCTESIHHLRTEHLSSKREHPILWNCLPFHGHS